MSNIGSLTVEEIFQGKPFDSAGRTITEADVVNFSGVSGDFSPVHSDETAMKESIYGTRIAHGLLIMSVGSALAHNARPFPSDASYGYEKVRFLAPVFFGDTIRVRQTLESYKDYPKNTDKLLTYVRYDTLNQDDKIVVVCTHILLSPRPSFLKKT